MSSNSNYQVLRNQDDEIDALNENRQERPRGLTEVDPGSIPVHPPPPYVADASVVDTSEPSNEPPPQYVDVVKLPTYTESENLVENDNNESGEETNHRFFFWFLHGDAFSGQRGDDEPWYDTGSDAAFMFSFLLALIFNWLGFLVSYCFTRSLASYYGAISGFGISLVKWAFIAQHSEWSRDFMVENPWFCYAFVLFGWVIFMRGIFAYIQMKRLAHRNNSENTGGVANTRSTFS